MTGWREVDYLVRTSTLHRLGRCYSILSISSKDWRTVSLAVDRLKKGTAERIIESENKTKEDKTNS